MECFWAKSLVKIAMLLLLLSTATAKPYGPSGPSQQGTTDAQVNYPDLKSRVVDIFGLNNGVIA
jgi:hypothetical protein